VEILTSYLNLAPEVNALREALARLSGLGAPTDESELEDCNNG
jgi:hypothetical protein